MLPKCLIIFGILVGYAKCGSSFKSVKFDRIREGARADEGSIAAKFTNVSLIQCSTLCLKYISCNTFQFAKLPVNSQLEGSCEILDYAVNLDALASSITEDLSYNIYRDVIPDEKTTTAKSSETTPTTTVTDATTTVTDATTTVTEATTTVTEATTTVTDAATTMTETTTTVIETTTMKTDPICDYADAPVAFTCNCSVSSTLCTGILQCLAKYSDKSVYYYLDRSKTYATYSPALSYCKGIDMGLIMIKTMEEQSTICNILAAAVGTSTTENFWMALVKESGNGDYAYSDGDTLGTLDVWGEKSPHGYVYLVGGSGHFKWSASKKGDGKEIKGETTRAMCSKVIV